MTKLFQLFSTYYLYKLVILKYIFIIFSIEIIFILAGKFIILLILLFIHSHYVLSFKKTNNIYFEIKKSKQEWNFDENYIMFEYNYARGKIVMQILENQFF